MKTVAAILFGLLLLVFIVDAATDFSRTAQKWKVMTAVGAVVLGSIGLYVAGGVDWQTKLSAYSLAVIVVGGLYLLFAFLFGSKSN
jgi:integral membrane sensor domain MASE1